MVEQPKPPEMKKYGDHEAQGAYNVRKEWYRVVPATEAGSLVVQKGVMAL